MPVSLNFYIRLRIHIKTTCLPYYTTFSVHNLCNPIGQQTPFTFLIFVLTDPLSQTHRQTPSEKTVRPLQDMS